MKSINKYILLSAAVFFGSCSNYLDVTPPSTLTESNFDKTKSPSDVNLFLSNWTDYYKAVYRCNVLLQHLDGVAWGSQANLKTTYESETRFIRAFLYFDMVK